MRAVSARLNGWAAQLLARADAFEQPEAAKRTVPPDVWLERRPQSGPPAHWAERVRQSAPHLLQPDPNDIQHVPPPSNSPTPRAPSLPKYHTPRKSPRTMPKGIAPTLRAILPRLAPEESVEHGAAQSNTRAAWPQTTNADPIAPPVYVTPPASAVPNVGYGDTNDKGAQDVIVSPPPVARQPKSPSTPRYSDTQHITAATAAIYPQTLTRTSSDVDYAERKRDGLREVNTSGSEIRPTPSRQAPTYPVVAQPAAPDVIYEARTQKPAAPPPRYRRSTPQHRPLMVWHSGSRMAEALTHYPTVPSAAHTTPDYSSLVSSPEVMPQYADTSTTQYADSSPLYDAQHHTWPTLPDPPQPGSQDEGREAERRQRIDREQRGT